MGITLSSHHTHKEVFLIIYLKTRLDITTVHSHFQKLIYEDKVRLTENTQWKQESPYL